MPGQSRQVQQQRFAFVRSSSSFAVLFHSSRILFADPASHGKILNVRVHVITARRRTLNYRPRSANESTGHSANGDLAYANGPSWVLSLSLSLVFVREATGTLTGAQLHRRTRDMPGTLEPIRLKLI